MRKNNKQKCSEDWGSLDLTVPEHSRCHVWKQENIQEELSLNSGHPRWGPGANDDSFSAAAPSVFPQSCALERTARWLRWEFRPPLTGYFLRDCFNVIFRKSVSPRDDGHFRLFSTLELLQEVILSNRMWEGNYILQDYAAMGGMHLMWQVNSDNDEASGSSQKFIFPHRRN